MSCFYNAYGEYMCKQNIEKFTDNNTVSFKEKYNFEKNDLVFSLSTQFVRKYQSDFEEKTDYNSIVSNRILINAMYDTIAKELENDTHKIPLSADDKNSIVDNITSKVDTVITEFIKNYKITNDYDNGYNNVTDNNKVVSNDKKCGPKNKHKICPGEQCCSDKGICGGKIGTNDLNFCKTKNNYNGDTYGGMMSGLYDGNTNDLFCGPVSAPSAPFCKTGCCSRMGWCIDCDDKSKEQLLYEKKNYNKYYKLVTEKYQRGTYNGDFDGDRSYVSEKFTDTNDPPAKNDFDLFQKLMETYNMNRNGIALTMANNIANDYASLFVERTNYNHIFAKNILVNKTYPIYLELLDKNKKNAEISIFDILYNIDQEMINIIEKYIYTYNISIVSTDKKCGPNNDHKICPKGQCCSSDGLCGGKIGKIGLTFCKNNPKSPQGMMLGIYDGKISNTSQPFVDGGNCGPNNNWALTQGYFCDTGCCIDGMCTACPKKTTEKQNDDLKNYRKFRKLIKSKKLPGEYDGLFDSIL